MAVLICAHRGASGYAPENTMKAFKLAHIMDAAAIETDVHTTSDGEIVLIHDEDISRITGRYGIISKMTLQQVRQIDFGQGELIPTLEECLSFISVSKMTINIELKQDEGAISDTLLEKVSNGVMGYNLAENTIISSFDHDALCRFGKINSEIPLAVLHSKEIADPGEFAVSCGAKYMHPHFSLVNEAYMKSCAEKGILVNPWTVNDPLDIIKMRDIGVNMIITNFPDTAYTLCRAKI